MPPKFNLLELCNNYKKMSSKHGYFVNSYLKINILYKKK